MSYFIESLSPGDTFEFNNNNYIITYDYKKNGDRLAINLKDGSVKWFNPSDMINKISIFYMNQDHHMIAIKESSKNDIS
jgi:hypothetical protein